LRSGRPARLSRERAGLAGTAAGRAAEVRPSVRWARGAAFGCVTGERAGPSAEQPRCVLAKDAKALAAPNLEVMERKAARRAGSRGVDRRRDRLLVLEGVGSMDVAADRARLVLTWFQMLLRIGRARSRFFESGGGFTMGESVERCLRFLLLFLWARLVAAAAVGLVLEHHARDRCGDL